MLSRGTTVTMTFNAPEGLDMTIPTKVWVTFSTMNEKELLTVEPQTETDKVIVELDQEDTLKLKDAYLAQINWLYEANGKIRRATSNKIELVSERNLKNEVLDAD